VFSLLAAAKPYYTHENDWILWVPLVLMTLWVFWDNQKEPDEDYEPYAYGFWDETDIPVNEITESRPYFYDWEREEWFAQDYAKQ